MSHDGRSAYEFPRLPMEPVGPGTALLVAGEPFAGTNRVTLEMLAGGESRGDGVLLVGLDESAPELIEDYTDAGGTYDRSRTALIECDTAGVERDDANIRVVGSPSDLTGIGIEFSSLYEGLYNGGAEHVRVGLFTVSTLLMYTDDVQPVFRFLHTLAGRVRQADGFAACVVDPSATDERTLSSISQPFDGRLDVRETDEGIRQLRVQGLDGQPDGWQPVD